MLACSSCTPVHNSSGCTASIQHSLRCHWKPLSKLTGCRGTPSNSGIVNCDIHLSQSPAFICENMYNVFGRTLPFKWNALVVAALHRKGNNVNETLAERHLFLSLMLACSITKDPGIIILIHNAYNFSRNVKSPLISTQQRSISCTKTTFAEPDLVDRAGANKSAVSAATRLLN